MFEKYYKHTQENEVRFLRGRPGEVVKKGDNFIVRTEDTLKGEFVEIEADMVVLSTAIEPSEVTREIAQILNGLTTGNSIFIPSGSARIS